MPDAQPFFFHTCRRDNGLCFAHIAMPEGDNKAWFQFADRSVYLMGPLRSIELWHIVNGVYAAGCWYSKILAKRRKYFALRKDVFPSLPRAGWLSIRYQQDGKWLAEVWNTDVEGLIF
jgi:hypothetical protein